MLNLNHLLRHFPVRIFSILVLSLYAHDGFTKPKAQARATSNPSPTAVLSPLDLFQQVKATVLKNKSYSMIQTQQERFGNKMGPMIKTRVKYLNGRIYLKMLDGPKKNAEILYGPGWNDGDVKVHKGSFPDITVNFNPHHSILLEDQHHTIDHLGFQFIINQISDSLDNCHNASTNSLKMIETLQPGMSSSSYWVEFDGPWSERKETVRKGEDLWSFAKRVNMDPYVILHNNKLEEAGDISTGMTLMVPRCYANRIIFGVDKQTTFLSHLNTFDKQGRLYETYEWKEIDTKTPLSSKDFDPDNPEYHF
jgi:hypothetical protein